MSYPPDPGYQGPPPGGQYPPPGGPYPPGGGQYPPPGGGYPPPPTDPFQQPPAPTPDWGQPAYPPTQPTSPGYPPPSAAPASPPYGQPGSGPPYGQPGSAPPYQPGSPAPYGQDPYGQPDPYGQGPYGQGQYGPPPPPRRSRKGLMIVLAVAASVLVLCAGGGLLVFFLTGDSDRDGAETPVAAAQAFLHAVYRDMDADSASSLVCSEARDESAMTEKIDEIRGYEQAYASPQFTWSSPRVVDENGALVTVATTVTMVTGDEKTSDLGLRISVLDKDPEGWWVCNLATEAVEPGPPPAEDGADPEDEDPDE